jgi:hypothetical protein
MRGGRRDQMREALEGDGVARFEIFRDGLAKRQEFGHARVIPNQFPIESGGSPAFPGGMIA